MRPADADQREARQASFWNARVCTNLVLLDERYWQLDPEEFERAADWDKTFLLGYNTRFFYGESGTISEISREEAGQIFDEVIEGYRSQYAAVA